MENVKSSQDKLLIVYEDDSIIVVNKPKRMLTHHTKYEYNNTVVDLLINKINKEEFADQSRPGIVQRLDKNTTGLMVIAKTLHAYNNLINQIATNKLVKRYLAIVHGHFKTQHTIIKCPIIRSNKNTTKMIVSDDPKAKDAITEVSVLKTKGNISLIECKLVTGRTHQIRVHMNYVHHYVYNDPLYGHKDGYEGYDQFLHSHYLGLFHPITNEFLEFNSIPDETFYKPFN